MVLPLAVAGQNIAILLSGILLLESARRKQRLNDVLFNQSNRIHLALFALYGFTCIFSTWLNPNNPENPFVACGGFLGIWLLPALINTGVEGISTKLRVFTSWAMKWVPYFFLLWGFIALSQMVFEWKLAGSSFVSTLPRAQGFYSHPLTLAYVGLVLFPFVTVMFLRQPKKFHSVVLFIGVLLLLIASKSRAAQAIGFLILLWNVWLLLKGKTRLIVVGLLFLSVVGTLITENPVSSRFHQMVKNPDAAGGLVDDRVVFWEVHWQMFKERPLLGHGENLGTAYRTIYYNALGYQDFQRKYEAHNLLLQILVNTGVIGITFFLVWLGWVFWVLFRSQESEVGQAPLQSVLALLVGGMTQNAFQDSEVRYAFILVVVIAVMFSDQLHKSKKLES
jgi:O-antigen ligase